MLRIPVCMHNVPEGDISALWNHLLDILSVAKADSANINCDKGIDIRDLVALFKFMK